MERIKQLLTDPNMRRETFSCFVKELAFRFGDIVIMTGSSNPKLAHNVGYILRRQIDEPITYFDDTETLAQISKNSRQKHVFIIQSTSPPVNDSVMELFLMADAARRASAKEVTAIIPYYGYGRSDKKDRPHVSMGAAMVGRILESLGVDRVVTVDVHAEQSQGFIKGPWDNLYASYVLVPKLLKLQRDFVVVSPDSGGVRRAGHYVDVMDAVGIAMAAKRRDHRRPGKSRVLTFAGDVEGASALMVDDMIAGGRTLFGASEVALEHGATEVFAATPHGLFLGDFLERLSDSPIKMIYTTDTIQHRPEVLDHPKIQVVSIAPLIAAAIPRICTGRSISQDLFLHSNHR